MPAREISAPGSDVAELDGLIGGALAGDEARESPLAIPGIGPKTAAAPVTAVDISLFASHREPAGYRGAAPADSGSGTGIRSTSPQRGGSKQLENLLIFSRSPLVGTRNRFGRRYDERRARGGDGAQQGAQGRREEEDEGRLRDHAGRGPVRAPSIALGANLVGGEGARAPAVAGPSAGPAIGTADGMMGRARTAVGRRRAAPPPRHCAHKGPRRRGAGI